MRDRNLFLVLSLYLLLTVGYGIINPLFEAPDEHHHYFTVQHIVERGQLPVAGGPEDLARQEAAQPPLYYLLGAAIIAGIDTTASPPPLWFNPYVQLGDARSGNNPNAFVHTPEEAWPWQGHVLAGHLLRIFSAVLGLGTLWAIYASARLLWPQQPQMGWVATAVIAFLPQFNFLHSAISNDPLIILFSSLALWQMIRIHQQGGSRQRFMLLGLTIGLAILAKVSGLLLLVLLVGLLVWRDGRSPRRLLTNLSFSLGPSLLVAGWLLGRNWFLYGDITAANRFIELAGGDRYYTVSQVLADLDRVALSAVAFFGWMTVQPPGWVYWVWGGVLVTAVLTALHHLFRHKTSPTFPFFMLTGWCLLVGAGWFQFSLRTPADQGRLLFPVLLPVALALAYGLGRYRWRKFVPVITLITTLYCLLVTIPQAYAPPPILTEVPADVCCLRAEMGQGLTVLAANIGSEMVHPGDWLPITLYWQARSVPNKAPVEVVEFLGREGASIGKLHTYHGGGRLPATLWPVGSIVVDEVWVQVLSQAAVPTQATLFVRLLDGPAPVAAGTVKIVPGEWPDMATPLAQLGGGIELVEAQLAPATAEPGTTVTLHLRWQIRQDIGQEYITFVHLGDPTRQPLAQADGVPLNGYYPTNLWARGEVFGDEYELLVPEGLADGRYPIHIGLYDPTTGARLPLSQNNQRQPQDAYFVGWLEVQRKT